ncbi:MAG: helix-turn-helix domain-containing protein [Oscillospiraceae bacterium]|nr:helix-turn-helix domain-containing protein [Oscillospiraceae bacterium]
MYIYFGHLMHKMQQKLGVTIYHSDQLRAITRVEMFPFSFQGDLEDLDQDTLWIFEYRQLMQYNPETPLPPFLCVVEHGTISDPVFFVNRTCGVISSNSVAQTLTALAECCFECGNESAPLAEKTHQMLQYTSMQDLLEQGAEVLNNPLLLTDENQKIIGFSNPDKVSSLRYREMIQLGGLPVGHPSAENILAEQKFSGATIYMPGVGDVPNLLCKEIRAGDRVLGYLQSLQFNKVQPEEAPYMMEMLGNLLAVELTRHPVRKGMDREKQIEQFLRDLLDNKAGSTEVMQERQQKLHLDLKKNLYTITICNAMDDHILRLPLYDLAQRWANLIGNSYGFIYHNSVFILHSRDDLITDFEATLKPLAEELKKYDMISGISNSFRSLLQIRRYGYQSRKAIELGQMLNPDKRIYAYSDYALYHMMEVTLRGTEVENFYPPEMQKLIDISEENGNVLLETLEAFLRMGRNKAKTAKELGVHINTVKYRLAQIEQVMQIDLDDIDNTLQLMIAYKMLEFRKSFPVLKSLTSRF